MYFTWHVSQPYPVAGQFLLLRFYFLHLLISAFLCLSPRTEGDHECLDHCGVPLSGLFDSPGSVPTLLLSPLPSHLVYSRILPQNHISGHPLILTPPVVSQSRQDNISTVHTWQVQSLHSLSSSLHHRFCNSSKYLLKTCQASGTKLDAGDLQMHTCPQGELTVWAV